MYTTIVISCIYFSCFNYELLSGVDCLVFWHITPNNIALIYLNPSNILETRQNYQWWKHVSSIKFVRIIKFWILMRCCFPIKELTKILFSRLRSIINRDDNWVLLLLWLNNLSACSNLITFPISSFLLFPW